MSLIELRRGSCLSKRDGFFAWWEHAGKPPIIVMADPPYLQVTQGATTKKKNGKRTGPTRLSYGALTPALMGGIAEIVAIAEYAIVYGTFESTGAWRDAIKRAGGIYCGTALVKQHDAAPRLVGDAPSVRHLAAIMGRRKGRTKWKGRTWAEWSETRARVASDRPIKGTRGIGVLIEMIGDMADTAKGRTGVMPIVVDPCAGTGTTLVAARKLGLEAIAWERDRVTHAYALRVISGQGRAVEGQGDLGIGLPSIPA